METSHLETGLNKNLCVTPISTNGWVWWGSTPVIMAVWGSTDRKITI
jgi:hypothetical protein